MKTVTMAAVGLAFLFCGTGAHAGPLEDYLKRPDPAYGWKQYGRSSGLLGKYFFLRLQSQHWLDAERVDRPLWEHQIRIAQPRSMFCGDLANTGRTGILIIGGGHNPADGTFGTDVSFRMPFLAQAFCRPIIEVRQVPNGPLRFTDETHGRKEDAIIAYSFDRYLNGKDGDWPVQLAMVRSVVQAMNAIQEFSRTRDDMPDLDSFVVLGASKRGWTAWLTAAVDPRVRAVIPVSIDMPSMAQQFMHHVGTYGDYSTALNDYKSFNIGCRMASERGAALREIVDPIAYRDRLTLPKFVLNSAGDQYFVSDSWRFYYDQLRGPKRLRYTVNSDHSHGDVFVKFKLFMQARNWINDVLAGREPPALDWERRSGGILAVRPNQTPREVRLWTAENGHARDFRLETLGAAWTPQPLERSADGTYQARLGAPARGWRAHVVEAVFGGPHPYDQQVYTTGVYVEPDSLPHPARLCTQPVQTAG